MLLQEPDEVFPNFELPSDLHGVVFDNISKTGWQNKLGAKSTAAKFKLISALYGSATDTSRGGGMSALSDAQKSLTLPCLYTGT